MPRKLNCSRCGTPLQLLKRERIQLGKTGWILGDLDNLLSGGLDVDILTCPSCGGLEFFQGGWSEMADPESAAIARTKCPGCGKSYEMDSPKCPFCGQKNTALF